MFGWKKKKVELEDSDIVKKERFWTIFSFDMVMAHPTNGIDIVFDKGTMMGVVPVGFNYTCPVCKNHDPFRFSFLLVIETYPSFETVPPKLLSTHTFCINGMSDINNTPHHIAKLIPDDEAKLVDYIKRSRGTNLKPMFDALQWYPVNHIPSWFATKTNIKSSVVT